MKRYGWIVGAFLIVALLMAIEMTLISNVSGYGAKEKVVFAKVHIDKNAVITGDMLELKEIDTGAVHPNALKNSGAAISKRAAADIEAGEMLLSARLMSGASGVIEAEDKSKRLFSVKFEADQANGWQLADGQYVDIIYVPNQHAQPDQAAGAEGEASVFQASGGVKVLKNIRIAGLIDENSKLVDANETKDALRYVSFEVTEEQASFLAYAKSNGKLELSTISEKQ